MEGCCKQIYVSLQKLTVELPLTAICLSHVLKPLFNYECAQNNVYYQSILRNPIVLSVAENKQIN